MSTSASRRRIVVLLPRSTPSEDEDRLLEAACALARGSAHALNVIELSPPGTPPLPHDLPLACTWWHAPHPALTQPIGSHLAQAGERALVASGLLAGDAPLLLLLPPGPQGVEVAAHMATHLQAAVLGGCSSITLDDDVVVARRAGWGGRIAMTLHSDQAICVATLRTAAEAHAGAATLEPPSLRTLTLDDMALPSPEITPVAPTDAMPPLEGAPIVVAGGRGMQGEDGFALLRSVAEQLGASLGGSLPTVDAGWVPVARQIGQSGKFVSPRLYLAVGISGTPQHLAGIAPGTPIIALNKDPDAPIFKVARTGIVGDWRELLPPLLDELRADA